MILQGKAAEYALLQKLASFTKIPKAEFIRETLTSMDTREELPLVQYPILMERFRGNFDPLFYCVTVAGKGSLNLLHLLDASKWLKSPIREAFFQGARYLTSPAMQRRYGLITYLTGTVWVTTLHDWRSLPGGQDFTGAILLQDKEAGGVFVTRPIRNYLRENLGILGSED